MCICLSTVGEERFVLFTWNFADLFGTLSELRRDAQAGLCIAGAVLSAIAVAAATSTLNVVVLSLAGAVVLCLEVRSFCAAMVFVGGRLTQASVATKILVTIVAPLTHCCAETWLSTTYFSFTTSGQALRSGGPDFLRSVVLVLRSERGEGRGEGAVVCLPDASLNRTFIRFFFVANQLS